MAFQWLVIGKARAKGRGEGPSLAITVFFKNLLVFRLSVSIKEVAIEYPFYVLIHMNSYIFHICFISFIFLSKTHLISNF